MNQTVKDWVPVVIMIAGFITGYNNLATKADMIEIKQLIKELDDEKVDKENFETYKMYIEEKFKK